MYSGLADQQAYGKKEDGFQPSRIPRRTYNQKEQQLFKIYAEIDQLRSLNSGERKEKIKNLFNQVKEKTPHLWLAELELLEHSKNLPECKNDILLHLQQMEEKNSAIASYVREGRSFYS